MNTITLTSLSQIVELRDKLGARKNFCFRGQANAEWSLVPTLYRGLDRWRPPIDGTDGGWLGRQERDLFRTFKLIGRQELHEAGARNDWECLALAQHHGVPTRFLDWTRN